MGPAMIASKFFLLLERLYRDDSEQFQQDMLNWIQRSRLQKVFTPNPEQVMQAHSDPQFFDELLQGDVLLPDGTQLVVAARAAQEAGKVLHSPHERITGVDVLEWWLEEGKSRKVATALIGGQDGVAQALAKDTDPEQTWCFGHSGYAAVARPTPEEEQKLLDFVTEKQPVVLFVAFGAPWQERWTLEHANWLQSQGVRVVVVCGGALDVLSPASSLRRAPRWMRQLGLEWLFRLFQQPSRWKRQTNVLEFMKVSRSWIAEE